METRCWRVRSLPMINNASWCLAQGLESARICRNAVAYGAVKIIKKTMVVEHSICRGPMVQSVARATGVKKVNA
jgi:hypothetical protein